MSLITLICVRLIASGFRAFLECQVAGKGVDHRIQYQTGNAEPSRSKQNFTTVAPLLSGILCTLEIWGGGLQGFGSPYTGPNG